MLLLSIHCHCCSFISRHRQLVQALSEISLNVILMITKRFCIQQVRLVRKLLLKRSLEAPSKMLDLTMFQLVKHRWTKHVYELRWAALKCFLRPRKCSFSNDVLTSKMRVTWFGSKPRYTYICCVLNTNKILIECFYSNGT